MAKAIVSVNDIPEMRDAFKGRTMRRLKIRYTVAAMARAVAKRASC